MDFTFPNKILKKYCYLKLKIFDQIYDQNFMYLWIGESTLKSPIGQPDGRLA
jgi:hypothetical protein